MTDDGAPTNADRDLQLLRHALALLPLDLVPAATEPPASLIEGAEWVQDWYSMDAELAELTYDSTAQLDLTVRSTSALRELTFVSDGRTIEMEIEPGPRHVTVGGSVEPPVDGRVQLLVGGELFSAELAPDGSFEIEAVPYGTVLALIDTLRGKIRLGAFEV